MRFKLIAPLVGVCILHVLNAQTPKQYFSIESPNSTSLKGSLESPVTFNTGKTSISIPLYTIRQKDIEIPIVLSYNSGGVKLDVHPGWVGSNWSLQTGGIITRNIKGIPDELYWRNDFLFTDSKNTTGTKISPYGYIWNPINNLYNWNTTQRISDLAKAGMEPNTFWQEAEPDEFIFQCGQYSGTFLMDHTGALRVQSGPDVKVEGHAIYNIPLFDSSKPLNPNDISTFTSVAEQDIGTNPNGDPMYLYTFNRIRKAYLMGFKITTPDGLQYEFGMYGQSYDATDLFEEVEFTAGMSDQFYFDEIFTTWHLKKITAPNNEFVEFVYQRGDPVLQTGVSFSFYKAGGSAPAKGFLGFLFGGPSAFTQEAKWEWSGRFIRPVYLKKIISNTTIVNFSRSRSNELDYDYEPIAWQILDQSRFYAKDYFSPYQGRMMLGDVYYNKYGYSPGIIDRGGDEYSIIRWDGVIEEIHFNCLNWSKLDKITITSRKDNSIINEWGFLYNEVSTERLQLKVVQEKSMPPYEFEYDRSKTLQGYNALQIDHWGYYNGRVAPIDISSATSLQNYKDLRDPVEEFIYAGSLIKVTVPTKGSKLFTYEPNKYSSIVKRNVTTGAFTVEPVTGAEKLGGGLRIKQITEVYGEGTPDVITKYTYGSGTLMGDVQYYWPTYKGRLLNGNEYSSTRFVTETLLPVSENPGGGVVTYQLVTEEQSGNGKTVYEYNTFSSNPDETGVSIDLEKSPYSPFTSKGFERGLLKEVRKYEISNMTTPISTEAYTYTVNSGFSTDFIRAVEARGVRMFGSSEVNVIEGTTYKHYLHPFQLTKKTTSVRDKGSATNFFTTVEDYTYNISASPNNDNQLKETKLTNSSGEVLWLKYKHPFDFQVNDGAVELTGLNALKNKHIFNTRITEEKLKKPADLAQFFTTSFTVNTFRKEPSGLPVLDAIYDLKITDKINSHITTIGPSAFTLDPRMALDVKFNKYDEFGNLQQYTSNDGIPITLLYGYNHAYPIAEIKNSIFEIVLTVLGQATIDQLNSVNPGTDAQVRALLQPLRSAVSLDKALITTYTYIPLVGMTSMTDANNSTEFYEYDLVNRLKVIRDTNQHIIKTISYQYQFK